MKKQMKVSIVAGAGLAALLFAGLPATRSAPQKAQKPADWPIYGGNAENNRYSPLAQINRSNVAKLQVAWTYDSGETGGIETSPIIVGNVLYTYTPGAKVVRAVTYWSDGKDSRILAGVLSYVYELDAETGKPVPTFGKDGRIDMREGLGREPIEKQSVALSSPGIIYKDLFITGGENPETLPAPPGDIRAYDVHTGAVRWQFHTIPHPGE